MTRGPPRSTLSSSSAASDVYKRQGDFEEDTRFDPGEMRWVRPGFAYGPEYNGDGPMEITVFGTDTNPMFGDPPEGAYKVQKSIQETHVYAHQPRVVPHNATVHL
eukprot:TRINITY_DN31177_c0_g1_i1.p1 TRINITY_DN31177_c0_g1~~TRINITY_DN31177_c0_g1_i1.p1  ORF type:complete len:105 (+),score=17.61 TRINITY_DN31177_c0_g1_i1:50-364(+)